MNFSSTIWILILPLATFLVTGLFGNKFPKRISGILGTVSIGIAAVIAINIAYQYFFISGKTGDTYAAITAMKYSWLTFSPSLSIDMGILLDPISVMMLVVVTFVSFMVHLYSFSYMKDEEKCFTNEPNNVWYEIHDMIEHCQVSEMQRHPSSQE